MSVGWAKLHNDLWSSRKWMQTSLAAQGLWTSAVAYSNAMRTYGRIDGHLLALFRGTPELAAELVSVGLWDVDGDGWMIHDWNDHQTSREHAEAVSAKRAEAGRRGGKARTTERTEKPVTSDDKQNAKQTEANGSKFKQEEEVEEEEQLELLPPTPQGEPAPKAFVYPDAFETVWAAWPKTGDVKRTAYKAWTKATRGTTKAPPSITTDDLLAAVRRYAADPNLPEPRYIPALSVWINQARWEQAELTPRTAPVDRRPDALSQGMATVAALRAQRLGTDHQQDPRQIESRRIA